MSFIQVPPIIHLEKKKHGEKGPNKVLFLKYFIKRADQSIFYDFINVFNSFGWEELSYKLIYAVTCQRVAGDGRFMEM